MKEPLISVIVPVYNVEAYLEQCVDSLVGQTYRNLEIILIDDGSPDNCGAICDAYAQKDERIRVIHKENEGLSKARNAALELARGEYLAFVDSDDWLEPDTYERVMAHMQADPSLDVVLFASVREPRTEEGVCFAYYPAGTVVPGREMVRRILLDEVGSQPCFALYKRLCWEKVRFPEHRIFEDLAVTFRAYLPVRNVGFLPEPFYHYRTNQQGISIKPNPVKSYHIFLAFRDHFHGAQEYCPEVEGSCCAMAAHYAISAHFHYCAERHPALAPYQEEILEYLQTHKKQIQENLHAIPKTRKLALQVYYASPLLFRVLVRLLRLTGLQKKMGLEIK